jgi:hypothetical protein
LSPTICAGERLVCWAPSTRRVSARINQGSSAAPIRRQFFGSELAGSLAMRDRNWRQLVGQHLREYSETCDIHHQTDCWGSRQNLQNQIFAAVRRASKKREDDVNESRDGAGGGLL